MPASTRASYLTIVAAVIGVCAAGCDRQSDSQILGPAERPTQGAVGSAMRRVSRGVQSVIEPRAEVPQTEAAASNLIPEFRMRGAGNSAQLQVRPDEHHTAPQAVHTREGWAMTWGDGDHSRALFARMDDRGRPLGLPVVVRESRSAEEDVWSPAVAFTGDAYGMAWSDPANGRIRFVRLDMQGNTVGHATIVHEGLEMPLMTRVVYNGSEFGVAAAMHDGVYFARVNRDGERVGEGVVIAEGNPVASLDELTATPNGFALQWRDGTEAGAQHQAQINRDGQLVGNSGAVRRSAGIGRLASR